ncbi:MAG: SDR family oxidoreductase [Planctomycetota bacterium]|nr:SDR family oxidoreductase [Planctomycetota bacterium]
MNCIAPWYFRTPLTEPVLRDESKLEKIVRRTPLRRVGELSELASAAAFLCSDEAGYITGVTLPVDGGMSIHGFSPFTEC